MSAFDSTKTSLSRLLQERAREFVETVLKNVTIYWSVKEPVSAKLCVIVKRVLRMYGYSPDKQKAATGTVLQQDELLANVWMGHRGASS
jgi:type I restriction enzyme, R subunit